MKLLILSNFPIPEVQERHVEAIRRCAHGYEIVVTSDREAQFEEIADADIVFGTISPALFQQARKLRWVQAVGAGIDPMLFPEFVRSEVVLTSEKGHVGIHLAEHAFALLLALTRGVDRAVRHPRWETRFPIRERAWEIYDLTMGILGLGGTGLAVAQRAHGFGMRLIAIDPEDVVKPDYVQWVKPPEALAEMLGQSDVVVICAPLTTDTLHLFNAERFQQMRPGAVLIDVTRGEIIDGPALLDALHSGRLGGAGLDTPPGEPIAADNSLWNMENVIITPHTAGASPRRGDRIVELFCENLHRFQQGEPLQGVIDKQKGY